MKVIKSILGGLVDFLMLLVIIIALGVTLVSLTSDNNGVSKIGKYIPLSVQSESMEDTIYKGDFILMEECDVDSLKVGDVIAFFSMEQEQVIIKTHRIVQIDAQSGSKSFITRGDKNEADDYVPVFPSDIIGKWEGVRIAYVGSALDFVSSQYGFLLCIILPLFALFIYQIYRFIIVIIEEKNAMLKESIKKENSVKEEKVKEDNNDKEEDKKKKSSEEEVEE